MWSTVCEVISLKAVDDEQMKIRPCYGGWVCCDGDCVNCEQLPTYSYRTEGTGCHLTFSISTNTNT